MSEQTETPPTHVLVSRTHLGEYWLCEEGPLPLIGHLPPRPFKEYMGLSRQFRKGTSRKMSWRLPLADPAAPDGIDVWVSQNFCGDYCIFSADRESVARKYAEIGGAEFCRLSKWGRLRKATELASLSLAAHMCETDFEYYAGCRLPLNSCRKMRWLPPLAEAETRKKGDTR